MKSMKQTDHNAWLERSTQDSIRQIARTAGITHRTLGYQLEKGAISPENVIAIAEAYGLHPVGALVETGYLEEKWASEVDPVFALRKVTDDQIAEEVLRRMKIGTETNLFEIPLDELQEVLAQREAEERSERHLRAIADSSPDELEPGDDGYHDGP